MTLLFDAYWWIEGPLSNRTVQREFIQTWAHDFPQDELTMVVPRRHLDAARADAPDGVDVIGTRLTPHGAAAALAMPVAGRRARSDAIVTHNFTPLFGRSVVFIHDVLFQTNPEWFTRSERAYFAWMPLLARRADLVITSSRSEATRINGRNRRLRGVVPVGLAVRTELVAAIARRPDLPHGVDRFILTVGRLNVRKNLISTITAALDSGKVSAVAPLVVVGEGDGRRADLPDRITAALADGSVVMLASVDDAELAWLYGNADLFVFLSLDEGFGLTPVEALRFGCPCLVSDIEVFHETVGDRVQYAPPLDVAAAASMIASTLTRSVKLAPVELTDWSSCVARLRNAVAATVSPAAAPSGLPRPLRGIDG